MGKRRSGQGEALGHFWENVVNVEGEAWGSIILMCITFAVYFWHDSHGVVVGASFYRVEFDRICVATVKTRKRQTTVRETTVSL